LLADLERGALGGAPNRGERVGRGIDLQDRDVLERIDALDLGRIAVLVVERDLELGRPRARIAVRNDHVTVGDDVPLRVPDEAGSGSGGDLGGAHGEAVDHDLTLPHEYRARSGGLEYADR